MSQWSVTRRFKMTMTRRTIRWSAIGLNLAAAFYYAVGVGRFLFALDYPLADKLGFILSFKGFVFLAAFVAPALAVAALLGDQPD